MGKHEHKVTLTTCVLSGGLPAHPVDLIRGDVSSGKPRVETEFCSCGFVRQKTFKRGKRRAESCTGWFDPL